MAPLSIRNQSRHSLTLGAAEVVKQSTLGGISKLGIKHLLSKTSSNRHDSASHLPAPTSATGQSIAPFSVHRTNLDPQLLPADETYTITLTSAGKQHALVLPTTSPSSKFASRSISTSAEISAFYLPSSATLTIYTHPSPEKWMSAIPDSTPLSSLSIPGTHNSVTHHHALFSVRCQAVSPHEQLKAGVRFFDIRIQCPTTINDPNCKDDFHLVHGVFPISLTGPKYLAPLLTTIHEFLRQNPSETVICSLKREGRGAFTDQALSAHLATLQADWWYTLPTIPTLGGARGKMVLLRRFANAEQVKTAAATATGATNWGLDANGWAYNCANAVVGPVAVQDVCELKDRGAGVDAKTRVAIEHMQRAKDARSGPDAKLYLNFLSASNLLVYGCWPEDVAARLNPEVEEWLFSNDVPGARKADQQLQGGENTDVARLDHASGFGILVCDWVGKNGNWDLVRAIIGSNAALFA